MTSRNIQAESRVIRQRLVVRRLKTSEADTAAAEEALRLMEDAAALFRESAKTFPATLDAKPENAFFGSQVLGGPFPLEKRRSRGRLLLLPTDSPGPG